MTKISQRGIKREFRMNEEGVMTLENSGRSYQPTDLCILKTYRFEGDSNPDDNVALYVVKDTEGNLGMIIDSYGAESNYPGDEFDKFLREIPIQENEEFSL
ncbi:MULTISPECIES: hypothetical protein [Chryseobacterium]|nr:MULTISPECIES: hypothetical protein [Chryseobacterium]